MRAMEWWGNGWHLIPADIAEIQLPYRVDRLPWAYVEDDYKEE